MNELLMMEGTYTHCHIYQEILMLKVLIVVQGAVSMYKPGPPAFEYHCYFGGIT